MKELDIEIIEEVDIEKKAFGFQELLNRCGFDLIDQIFLTEAAVTDSYRDGRMMWNTWPCEWSGIRKISLLRLNKLISDSNIRPFLKNHGFRFTFPSEFLQTLADHPNLPLPMASGQRLWNGLHGRSAPIDRPYWMVCKVGDKKALLPAKFTGKFQQWEKFNLAVTSL